MFLKSGAAPIGRTRIVTATIVVVLAVGLGANVTAYAVLHELIFGKVFAPEPDNLVRIEGGERSPGGDLLVTGRLSVPDFVDVQRMLSPTLPMAAFVLEPLIWYELHSSELQVAFVSDGYFDLLGVPPVTGTVTGPGSRGVVVSERIWRRVYGARPDIAGHRIDLAGVQTTIVGVMPRRFVGTTPTQPIDIWLPMQMYESVGTVRGALDARDYRAAYVIGRLPPDSAAAVTGLDQAARSLTATRPEHHRDFGLRMVDGSHLRAPGELTGPLRMAWAAFVVFAAVYLIALTNAASLLLSAELSRSRETATRIAMGASFWRLARVGVGRAGIISGVAALGALTICALAFRLLSQTSYLAAHTLGVNLHVVAAAGVAGFVTTLILAIIPAFVASRINITSALRGGVWGGQPPKAVARAQGAFIAAQLFLAIALLTGATTSVRGFMRALHVDPGYDADRLLFVKVVLRTGRGFDQELWAQHYMSIRDALQSVPGVRDVSQSQLFPLGGTDLQQEVVVPGHGYGPGEDHRVSFENVGPNYFNTLGVGLLEGRDFDDRDGWRSSSEGPTTTVVNAAFAHKFWPDESALGRQILLRGRFPLTVIAVAPDLRDQSLAETTPPRFYIASQQSSFFVLVRTAVAPRIVATSVHAELRASGVPMDTPTLVIASDARASFLQMPLLVGRVLSIMSVIGLTLACTGLHALVTLFVGHRRHELAVRRALGAGSTLVLRTLLRPLTLPILAGLLGGTVAATAITTTIRATVVDMPGTDSATLLANVAALTLAVILAMAGPFQRTMSDDLARTLRVQ